QEFGQAVAGERAEPATEGDDGQDRAVGAGQCTSPGGEPEIGVRIGRLGQVDLAGHAHLLLEPDEVTGQGRTVGGDARRERSGETGAASPTAASAEGSPTCRPARRGVWTFTCGVRPPRALRGSARGPERLSERARATVPEP